MIPKLYKIALVVFAIGLSFFSSATEETYSVRRSADEITIGSSFEVIDGRFGEIGLDHFKDKETRFLVKFGIEERDDYGYFDAIATIDAEITIEALGPLGEVLTTKTEHLIIEYNPSGGVNAVDMDAVLDAGHHRYRVTIDDITGVASIPDYVFMEGELQIDRYYELDDETIPTLVTDFIAYGATNTLYREENVMTGEETGSFFWETVYAPQEIELFWPYIEGAEEYELEWTWVDNYDAEDFDDGYDATSIEFSERDFELNNTRVITKAQTYRIPLIYAKGYLIYRVRAVGRWTDNDLMDTDKLLFGKWSSDAEPTLENVGNWPNYIEISTDHEAIKNWQYQAVYAEEGKKKEIVSYFDGSLRNRQTVTRINSNKEAIVGENVYDNQGRSAVQILPTPVENAALRYYIDLNKSTAAGNPVYTHYDFDWNSDGECIANAIGMDDGNGASKYYSANNDVEDNWQDYVPDAEEFPFVQVEYTPDNTGRIRRQSGVGADYTIDGDHATQYFYLQAGQEELNRLFGYKVGNAQHYKKNLVVDANGQVSISYIDPQGRVVATALAGDNAGLSEDETITNLLSLEEHGDGDNVETPGDPDYNHKTVTSDLLNKLGSDEPDTELDNNQRFQSGKQGASYDGLRYNAQYASVNVQTHEFEYSIETDRFQDDCMADDVYYPYAYDLTIDLRDDCGTDRLSYDHDGDGDGVDPTDNVENIRMTIGGVATAGYIGAVGTSRTIPNDSLIALLQTGAYTLSKVITVNPDTLEKHLEHYLENLEPECLPDFFVNNVDCDGDEYPDIIDGERIFGDYDLTSCNISTQTMMADLMPGGQYGGTDPEDLASIFHLENVLAQGAFEDLDKNWQNIPINADLETIPYKDENGDLSYVEVEWDDSEFAPELIDDVVDPDDTEITEIDGRLYVQPQYLANAEDFIANWEGTWAASLLPYHPEYSYYRNHYKHLCENTWGGSVMVIEDGEPAVAASSETYNLALQFITEFSDASTASNPFLTSLVPTSGASHPIRNLDPYFNLDYTHFETLNDGTGYTSSSVNDYKDALIDEIIAEYKNNSIESLADADLDANNDLDLWQYAVKIVVCGSDFTEDCDLTGGAYPGGTFFDGLSDEEKDRIWNTYKQFYLAEKRKIDQILLDSYAIRNGFFNGYIDADEPEGINLGSFIYYGAPHVGYNASTIGLNAIYLDAITNEGYASGDGPFPWFDNDEVSLFAEKVKRFEPIYGLYDAGLPEGDVLLDDMEGMADATIFTSTGQCAMLMDAENFLRALSENSLLFNGATVNSNEFPWLTEDLYEGMNGGSPVIHDIDINVTISGGDFSVVVENGATGSSTGMRTINLDAPAGGDIDFTWDWADVTKLRMMYYEPESESGGVYPFQILAELDEVTVGAETVYREVVLNGDTEVEIGDCFTEGDLEEPLCDRDENFANDIRAIFTHLYDPAAAEGDFNVHTDVDATTVLGGWFAYSEMATQLGDNPALPISKITSTATSFRLEMNDLDRAIEVTFATLPISYISIVTGAVYDEGTGNITLYYIDESGNENSIIGSVDTETIAGATATFMQLDCMCDEEAEYSNSFEILLNELLTLFPTGFTHSEAPYYESDATAFIQATVAGTSSQGSINQYELTTSHLSFTIQTANGAPTTQCDFRLIIDEGALPSDIINLNSVYGLEIWEATDPDHAFELTAYGVLDDGTIVTLKLAPGGAYHTSGGCFQKIGCGCTYPATLAPQSCTDQLQAYNEVIDVLNGAIAIVDADDLYDVSFPIILETGDTYDESAPLMMNEEEFCATRLAYGVIGYLEYLDEFDIEDTDDDNYISLGAFANTGLNYYYLDELKRNVADDAWESGTNSKIDPIEMYKRYLDDLPVAEPALNWGDYVDGIYLTEQKICPPNPMPYYPEYEGDFPCEEWTANTDTVNAKNQEEIYLEKLANNFRERYIDDAITSVIETFEATYYDKEYHYTLYYYDQAGNLIQTVPPKGIDRLEAADLDNDLVNKKRHNGDALTPAEELALDSTTPDHGFETQYFYNSLNQLVRQITPDGGESFFGYDELGRLVVSQNAKQLVHASGEQFSYTRYDELGRIIEVGEMTVDDDYGFDGNGRFIDPSDLAVDVSDETFPGNLGADLEKIEEVTKTQYDQLIGMDAAKFADYSPHNTRNRITGVYYYETYFDGVVYLDQANYDNATFYDYDVHGNVKELIQDNNDEQLEDLAQDEKKVEYEYDLVSGNVKHVTYQKDKLDQFIHEYEYDADNRITNVRTSHDNVLWEQDAKYFYYDHGPLARTEIGEKKVQSNDFAYTIQGWLKGVNSENLDATKDQGKDGRYATAGTNKMNGKDVFGYSLYYYDGDYSARHGNDFLALSSTATPYDHDKDLYNGNIREMYTASTNTGEGYIGTSHTWYNYDQLNRIRTMQQEKIEAGTTEERYGSTYSYDENGNLETLTRKAWGDPNEDDIFDLNDIDNFTYHYKTGTNQLEYVEDALGAVLGSDLDDQSGFHLDGDLDYATSSSNYHYDEIGQLVHDKQENIKEIDWKVTGKVHKITWDDDSPKDNLEFLYDAMGNRIQKIMTWDNGDIDKTYYIRDAQGNVMSIYNLTKTGEFNGVDQYDLHVAERNIYGSSRVGTENPDGLLVARTGISVLQEYSYERDMGDKRYELSNHLGNVLNVVTDRKLQMETTEGSGILDYYTADVIRQEDFFPFGMSTGSETEEGVNYRYKFNGKEDDSEVYGNGNIYDYGFRIYNPRLGKFLSQDPLTSSYPWYTPYQFAGNTPIMAIDLDGLEEFIMVDQGNGMYLAIWDISARDRDQAGTIIYLSSIDDINNIAPDDPSIRKVNPYEAENGWIDQRRKTSKDSRDIRHNPDGRDNTNGHQFTQLRTLESSPNFQGEIEMPANTLIAPPLPDVKGNSTNTGGGVPWTDIVTAGENTLGLRADGKGLAGFSDQQLLDYRESSFGGLNDIANQIIETGVTDVTISVEAVVQMVSGEAKRAGEIRDAQESPETTESIIHALRVLGVSDDVNIDVKIDAGIDTNVSGGIEYNNIKVTND